MVDWGSEAGNRDQERPPFASRSGTRRALASRSIREKHTTSSRRGRAVSSVTPENQSSIVQQINSVLRQEGGESEFSCCLSRDHNYVRKHTQQEGRLQTGPGPQKLRSCSIFTDQCGEAHYLLPFEEPVDLRVQRVGNGLPQCISGLPASVYDPAEIGLMNANHLGKPILPDPCLVDRQLQVRVNRSLVEFHFLLAPLDFAAKRRGCDDPKSTTSPKNLPRCNGTHLVTTCSPR
jgi:hypothetical protein